MDEELREKLDNGFGYEVDKIIEIVSSGSLVLDFGRVAFFTHMRVMHEFFYKKDARDFHIKDFLPEWDKKVTPEVNKWYENMCVYCSHLGKDRWGGEPCFSITKEFYEHYRNLIIEFLDGLESDIPPKLEKIREEIKKLDWTAEENMRIGILMAGRLTIQLIFPE